MITLTQKTAYEISLELAERVRVLRRRRKFTQVELAKRSGMSLASYKRFEQTGQIALASLIKIAIALRCEEEFDSLFTKPYYTSIEEVIAENR